MIVMPPTIMPFRQGDDDELPPCSFMEFYSSEFITKCNKLLKKHQSVLVEEKNEYKLWYRNTVQKEKRKYNKRLCCFFRIFPFRRSIIKYMFRSHEDQKQVIEDDLMFNLRLWANEVGSTAKTESRIDKCNQLLNLAYNGKKIIVSEPDWTLINGGINE